MGPGSTTAGLPGHRARGRPVRRQPRRRAGPARSPPARPPRRRPAAHRPRRAGPDDPRSGAGRDRGRGRRHRRLPRARLPLRPGGALARRGARRGGRHRAPADRVARRWRGARRPRAGRRARPGPGLVVGSGDGDPRLGAARARLRRGGPRPPRAGLSHRRALAEQRRRRAGEDRLRIAQELHDVVAHHMSLINVQASVALHLRGRHPEQVDEALRVIKGASKEALVELRSLIEVLREGDGPAPRRPAAEPRRARRPRRAQPVRRPRPSRRTSPARPRRCPPGSSSRRSGSCRRR